MFAQSTKKIFGYVYDARTNLPLIGSNIIIDGTGIGTTSNELGYFQFDNIYTGTYSITASFIGYKSNSISDININNDQPSQINFQLNPIEHKLDEVVVSSNKNYDQNFGNVKLYTREEIEKNNFQSVGELLQETAGVEIQSTGATGSSTKISIRGSQSNQVLVLLDGVQLNNQLGGDVDLSQIPTNIIERIEIYAGGNSAQFGSGAIGGTINIITRNQFKNEIKLNSTIGSFGYIKSEPIVSGVYKNVSYYLSYNYLKSNGKYNYSYTNSYDNQIDDIRLNGDTHSGNLFSRINYRVGNNLFSINGQWFKSERGIPGEVYSLTPYARSNNLNKILGFNYSGGFKKLNIKSDLIYSNSTSEYINHYPDDVSPKFRRLPKYHYEYNVKNIVGNLNVIYVPNDWYKLTSGYNIKNLDYRDKNFRPTLNTPINIANDFSQGLFIHQELKKNLNWSNSQIVLIPIIRYDAIKLQSETANRNEDKWSPGVSLYLSIGNENKLSFKSNYSKSFRIPTFADLFYQDVRVEGKPDLLPETGTNSEITFKAETNIWGNLSGEVTAFRNKIDNLIVWKLGNFEVFRPFNTDAEITGQLYSLEFSPPNKFLTFGISHTNLQPLSKNKNTTTYNKIIPYKPLESTKIKMMFSYKTLRATINYRLVGNRFVTEANTIEMPSYKVVDANLAWSVEVAKINLLWKFSATNITNGNYQIIRNYPLPLREWRLGFSISY